MALRLQCIITLLHPYNGHIPGRTCDFQIPAYVWYNSEGPTTLGGPLRPDRRRPWGPTDHSSSGRLCRPVFACLRLTNRGPTRRAISALALDIGFIAPDVLSLRAFGDRPEGGVPNSSPSEPRSDLREGRGFDSLGTAASRSATLRAGRRDGSRRSTVRVHL